MHLVSYAHGQFFAPMPDASCYLEGQQHCYQHGTAAMHVK